MKIMQYCSVCKAEYDMEVVPTSDGEDDGVVWLQCPSCMGFLPKVRSSADFAQPSTAAPAAAVEASPAAPPLPVEPVVEPDLAETADPDPEPDPGPDAPAVDPLDGLDLESAVPYRPWESYAEGDLIHHLAWDDYGIVLAKEILPGHRLVVKVQFSQAGVVRLIEQSGERP
jgi:hypothetical protein